MNFSIEDILKATRGQLISTGRRVNRFKSVSIDTRTISKNDIFIAIKGDRFDGHDFLNKAVANGARCLVVSKKIKFKTDVAVIHVKDTVKALGWLAQYHRQRFDIPIIAITGSAGKTTAKDIIAAVLSSKYRVLKNVKTENNHIGVPLTLLKLKLSHQMAVLETGTNQPGDIRWLSEVVCPNICVFMNIGDSHLAGLKTKAGVFREKLQLLKFMKDKGTVVYNKDDLFLGRLSQKNLGCRKISFSIKTKSANQATHITDEKNFVLSFCVHGQKYQFKSPAVHNVYNALVAICCGRLFDVDTTKILTRLKKHSFQDGRMEVKRRGKYMLINDTYNANPLSFKSAVNVLANLNFQGKKIVVCSDMKELGENSKKFHKDLGCYIGMNNIDAVYSIGAHAKNIYRGARMGNEEMLGQHFMERSDLHHALKTLSSPAAILFKGSRSTQMDKTYQYFLNEISKK